MATKTGTQGPINGSNGQDTLTGIAQNDFTQIHIYGRAGNDQINLDFENIDGFSYGHHARGDGNGPTGNGTGVDDSATNQGSDTFNFKNVHKVDAVVVGRIEDFDATRDTLEINGNEITNSQLQSGSGTAGGYSWRIVEYDADSRDNASDTQQWILIDTGQGYIFYALEGARVTDGSGGSGAGQQESHFIGANQGHQVTAAELTTLDTVGFVDPMNYVPSGYTAQGGMTINHDDNTWTDTLTVIHGTSSGDLIAGGLNDDSIEAGSGNDVVWGGSGSDNINASLGNDEVYGGFSDDSISGSNGHDMLFGGHGDDNIDGGNWADTVYGDSGDDTLFGGRGGDLIYGGHHNDEIDGGSSSDTLYGQNGYDTIYGGQGNDTLDGGKHRDVLDGGIGNDTLIGGSWSDTFVFDDGDGDDTITDFSTNNKEKIDLSDVSSITNFTDIINNHLSEVNGNAVIYYGTGTITLIGIDEDMFGGLISASDFIF